MIAIQFSPVYEDRVSIYLKQSGLKNIGVTYEFRDTPGQENERNCFWVFKYDHSKQVNPILSSLKEMKSIMGIDDLKFCHCYNDKEYYNQYSAIHGSIPWFNL